MTLEATVSAEIYSLDLDYAHVYTLRCLQQIWNAALWMVMLKNVIIQEKSDTEA